MTVGSNKIMHRDQLVETLVDMYKSTLAHDFSEKEGMTMFLNVVRDAFLGGLSTEEIATTLEELEDKLDSLGI